MNATERAALLEDLQLRNEMTATVDERTLEILDHRRSTGVVRRRGWIVRRALLTADLAGLLSALLIAEWIVNRHNSMGALDAPGEILVFAATLPAWALVAKLYGLYDHDEERADHSTTGDFSGVFHMVTVCTWVFAFRLVPDRGSHPEPPKLVIFGALAIGLVTLGRTCARALSRRHIAYVQNTIIVGAGDVGQLVARKFMQHPEYGINLVGFVDVAPKERRHDIGGLALLGDPERLPALVRMLRRRARDLRVLERTA